MKATDIKNVTCLGSGTIGASWALNFAMQSLNVTVYDISEEALANAKELVEKSVKTLRLCGALNDQAAEEIFARVTYTTDLVASLKDADYIQESVPDSLEIKHQIVEAIEKYAPVTALVGSSTSRQYISDVCANAEHKERYVGAHPYNPPHLVPLVELSPVPGVSEEAMDTVYEFFKSIRKEPIRLQKEVHGFVGNRIQSVLNRELSDLVGNGVVSLEDAQKAITFGPGFRWAVMGPNLILDLGNPKGYAGMKPASGINILAEVATWTKNPHPGIAAQLPEVRKNVLPAGVGDSRETAIEWRDQMLVILLKAHGLL